MVFEAEVEVVIMVSGVVEVESNFLENVAIAKNMGIRRLNVGQSRKLNRGMQILQKRLMTIITRASCSWRTHLLRALQNAMMYGSLTVAALIICPGQRNFSKILMSKKKRRGEIWS